MEENILLNTNNEVVGTDLTVADTAAVEDVVIDIPMKSNNRVFAEGCALGAIAGAGLTVGGYFIGKLIKKRRLKKQQEKLREIMDEEEIVEFYDVEEVKDEEE